MSQHPKESRDDQELICCGIEAIYHGIKANKKNKDTGMPQHHCSHIATSRPRFHKLLITTHFQKPFPKTLNKHFISLF